MAASSSSFTPTYKIDRLSNTNYRIWSIKMEMLLHKVKGSAVVDGTCLDPRTGPTHAAAHQAWVLVDSKV